MSYILDALKKAESERALGSVPDIHAQPVPLVTIDGKPALWRRPLTWVAAGLLIALAVLVRFEPWRAKPAPQTVPPAAPAPAAVPQPPVAAPAPTVVAPPLNAAPSRESAPAVARAEPPKPKPRPKPRPKEKPVKPAAAARPAAAVPAEAAPPAPAVAEPYIPALRELPANIQREIPALTVGGYIYASKPAERSILINNRLLREGEQIAPGLTLERMRPREAVFNYRGYRYRVPY